MSTSSNSDLPSHVHSKILLLLPESAQIVGEPEGLTLLGKPNHKPDFEYVKETVVRSFGSLQLICCNIFTGLVYHLSVREVNARFIGLFSSVHCFFNPFACILVKKSMFLVGSKK